METWCFSGDTSWGSEWLGGDTLIAWNCWLWNTCRNEHFGIPKQWWNTDFSGTEGTRSRGIEAASDSWGRAHRVILFRWLLREWLGRSLFWPLSTSAVVRPLHVPSHHLFSVPHAASPPAIGVSILAGKNASANSTHFYWYDNTLFFLNT